MEDMKVINNKSSIAQTGFKTLLKKQEIILDRREKEEIRLV